MFIHDIFCLLLIYFILGSLYGISQDTLENEASNLDLRYNDLLAVFTDKNYIPEHPYKNNNSQPKAQSPSQIVNVSNNKKIESINTAKQLVTNVIKNENISKVNNNQVNKTNPINAPSNQNSITPAPNRNSQATPIQIKQNNSADDEIGMWDTL